MTESRLSVIEGRLDGLEHRTGLGCDSCGHLRDLVLELYSAFVQTTGETISGFEQILRDERVRRTIERKKGMGAE